MRTERGAGEDGGVVEQLERLANRRDVRTADRANIRTMLRKVRGGLPLSYQERQNLWAYIDRYRDEGSAGGGASRPSQ